MSGLLFIIVFDWVMRRTVKEKRNGIRWDFNTTHKNLIFADDIALISSTWSHMQRKKSRLEQNTALLDWKWVSRRKKSWGLNNSERQNSIKIYDTELEDIDEFTYLGSTVTRDGGAKADIQKRLSKARVSFNLIGKVWKLESHRRKMKLRIFQSNVLPVLL